MTTTATDGRLLKRHHQLLLRVAGWAPDEVVCDARTALAEFQVADAAHMVLYAVLDRQIPIRPDDAQLLKSTLSSSPGTKLLARTITTDDDAPPGYAFTPTPPDPAAMAPPPLLLDLTGPDADPLTTVDAAAVSALDKVTAPVGLWRAWRTASLDEHDEPAVPVFVLQSNGDGATLPVTTALMQDAIADAGVDNPQVEVYGPGLDLPTYQRRARRRGALLWAAEPGQPATVARVFDSFDPATGGQFAADRPVLSGDEAVRVLRYLNNGTLLLATLAREHDVFDVDAGAVVPSSFRTDGTWIWTDAVAYYLRTYALSPHAELLAHIRKHDFTYTEPDPVAVHRALAALTTPPRS